MEYKKHFYQLCSAANWKAQAILHSFSCSGAAKQPFSDKFRTPIKIKLHSQILGIKQPCSSQDIIQSTLLYDEQKKGSKSRKMVVNQLSVSALEEM